MDIVTYLHCLKEAAARAAASAAVSIPPSPLGLLNKSKLMNVRLQPELMLGVLP